MEAIKKKRNSPLKERKCLCGCDQMFQPARRDQFHVNGLHTDFAYNHGKRKFKSAKQIKVDKQLVINDKLLDKYYKQYIDNEAVVFSLTLKADGFDPSYFIGNTTIGEEQFFKSYNYLFRQYVHKGYEVTNIKIQKKTIYVKRRTIN